MKQEAVYKQIIHDIKEKIFSGELKPGQKLESDSVYADKYKVSRNTVIKAFDVLRIDGFVCRVQGGGTYVSAKRLNALAADSLAKQERVISLVIWCGGNEFNPDSPENKNLIDDLERLIAELDGTREFHRACPYGGDSHSYQVNWMNEKYYSYYTKDKSVAVTEFSMGSPPCMESLRKMCGDEGLSKFPPDIIEPVGRCGYGTWGEPVERRESAFSLHDAHLAGAIFNKAMAPMSDVGIPHNWEDMVRYIQTAHGMLLHFGIDCWRSRWPYCTMSMSWVFNVICPASITWDIVDYYGIPKISYYYQKHAYEPLHAAAIFEDIYTRAGEDLKAELYCINDTLNCYGNPVFKAKLYDGKLKLISETAKHVNILPDRVTGCGRFTYAVPENAEPEVLFLVTELWSEDGTLLTRSQYNPRIGNPTEYAEYVENGPWISDIRNLRTTLDVRVVHEEENGKGLTTDISVTNTGSYPAYQVSLLSTAPETTSYSDNYFWLEPGETAVIKAISYEENTLYTAEAFNADAVTPAK